MTVYHLHAVDIRVAVAVHHRRLVYQNTVRHCPHRAFLSVPRYGNR
ncbi:hypothetical protein KCP73_04820 [Salmonella enterica subsp. enterica]|nr:hypothetical protein KCP73_04820 [Salmonella enterica subsp. enterica]